MYFRSWAATLLLGGCSLVYNANNLPNGTATEAGIDAVLDAPPDAAPDAEVIRDADGSMLALTGVFPTMGIFEGQGVGNSRPAIVVIEGSQIIPDATVTFTPDSGAPNIVPGAAMVSTDGDFIAVPIVANLDPNLHDGDTITFSVTVSQSGGTITRPVPGKLTLHGLDQLDGTAPAISALKPLYAEVNLTSDATFAGGTTRVEIRSTSSITVTGSVIGKAVGTTPGPDGCAVASCQGAGGNHAANKDGGGGGAGYGTMGTAGSGTGPGAAGTTYGDPLITTYDGFMTLVANKASGGGSGGVTGTCSAGGSGGAGGGSIELTADGDITISGSINVDGGAGAPGTCSVTLGGAGGGGGGAGGVILVRAGNMLSAGAALSAAGGVGGAGANGGTGGNGGAGRIRYDAAVGDAAGNPVAAHRGPAFLASTPLIVTTPSPMITLNGTSGDAFTVSVTDEGGSQHIDGEIFVFGMSNQIPITPLLQRGLNTLCIILDGGDRSASEATKCVNIAMLP